MAERLPVGAVRNTKSPPFSFVGPTSLPNDPSDEPVDRVNGQIKGLNLESNDSNGMLISSVPNTANTRSLGQNRQGHTESTIRNGNRTKESDARGDDEWVEQDEPGVYITLTALPGGLKDLKRVRFRCVILNIYFLYGMAILLYRLLKNRFKSILMFQLCDIDHETTSVIFGSLSRFVQ